MTLIDRLMRKLLPEPQDTHEHAAIRSLVFHALRTSESAEDRLKAVELGRVVGLPLWEVLELLDCCDNLAPEEACAFSLWWELREAA
jgi:hypothetical protein